MQCSYNEIFYINYYEWNQHSSDEWISDKDKIELRRSSYCNWNNW